MAFIFYTMIWQKEIQLNPRSRGIHLITRDIEKELPQLPDNGMLNVYVKHTSAGLTLNENADPTVRNDLENFLDQTVPEREPWYKHNYEGDDDMPAHIKSSLVGSSIWIPITNNKLNLGTWQGIYFCEFRNFGGSRRLVLSLLS